MKQMKARKTKEIDEINWIVFFRGRGLGPSHNPPQEQSTLCELRKRRKKEWIYWREGLLGCACLPCAEQWRVAPPLIHTKKTAQPFRGPRLFSSSFSLFCGCGCSLAKKDERKKEEFVCCRCASPKTFHSMKDKKLSSLSFHSHLAFVGLVLGSLPLCGAMAAAAALNPPKSINPNQPTQFTFTPFNLSFSICLVSSANGKKVKRWAPFIDFHFILV